MKLQVMPSAKAKADLDKKLMPPPKPREKRKILSEDEYVELLGSIIERDYFPDMKALKQKLTSLGVRPPTQDVLATVPDNMRVDDFFNHYNSEDNASFNVLHENDREANRRKYHWAYESLDKAKNGQLMLYYQNGGVLSDEERKHFDGLLEAPSQRGDERPSAPETWPIRARNQLMFPPELHTSDATCHVLRIENGEVPSQSSALSRVMNPHVGTAARAAKEILSHNTRLSASSQGSSQPSPLEPPHTPSVYSEPDTAATTYRPVAMTPSPMPSSAASPLITWGDICATPVILDPQPEETSAFRFQETSEREKCALELDAKRRKKQKTETKGLSFGAQTPLNYYEKANNIAQPHRITNTMCTAGRSKTLTPAAQALAQRLHGNDRDLSLRASYSPAPEKIQRVHTQGRKSESGKKSQSSTPSVHTGGLLKI